MRLWQNVRERHVYLSLDQNHLRETTCYFRKLRKKLSRGLENMIWTVRAIMTLYKDLCIDPHVCMHLCIDIYIYACERQIYIYILYIYILYIYTYYIYIHIYIYTYYIYIHIIYIHIIYIYILYIYILYIYILYIYILYIYTHARICMYKLHVYIYMQYIYYIYIQLYMQIDVYVHVSVWACVRVRVCATEELPKYLRRLLRTRSQLTAILLCNALNIFGTQALLPCTKLKLAIYKQFLTATSGA